MTERRFNRNFEFSVTTDAGLFTRSPPFRIVFDGTKSIRGGLNKLNVQLYGVAEAERLALVKDKEDRKRIPMSLKIGYGDRLENIFKGTVHVGRNRRGGPEFVTTLESLDGGFDFLTAFSSRTVKGGERAVDALLEDMPNTARGKITDRPTLTRPKVLVGNSAKLIDEMIGPNETWYIEGEQLFVIKDDEVTTSFIPVVSAATGLINTPERENKEVSFTTRLNPSVRIGQLAKLISQTAPHLNGVYRVETINFKGDNYGSEWDQACTGRLASTHRVL